MKLRLMTLPLRRQYGELVDSDDLPEGKAEHFVRIGVAVEVKAKAKAAKKADSAKKKKAETRTKKA